jgi:hypothetical protein
LVNEEAAAQQYLLELLGDDSEMQGLVNGVWLKSVPQSSLMPAVKIDRQDAEDLMVVGLARVWANLSFLVRGIVHWEGGGQPDWTGVRAIGDRIDALLHDHEGSNAEVAVHAFREESFTDETLESGDLFLHVGGIYRVRARAV